VNLATHSKIATKKSLDLKKYKIQFSQAIDISNHCKYIPMHSEISSLKSKTEKAMIEDRLMYSNISNK